MPKRTHPQPCKSAISSQPLHTASKVSQGKGFSPDRHRMTCEPASPKIAAKMPVLSSPQAGSLQQTQEASVRPTPITSPANDAAQSAIASELSHCMPPCSDADSAAGTQSTAAQSATHSWLTVGKRQYQKHNCVQRSYMIRTQLLLAQILSKQLKQQPALGRRQSWKSGSCWDVTILPAGVCRYTLMLYPCSSM